MPRAWVFGDNISTDLIIPGRYLVERDPESLAKHAMEGADPDFAENVEEGDIIVAGKNFGCGSSREHAPIALKTAGVSTIVAESFARIFYRNAINQGVPVLELPRVREEFESGDQIEVNLDEGIVKNLRSGKELKAKPLPPLLKDIVSAGSLLDYLKEK
ncbi:3-isopropylmalate dehydratase [candidate division MSBL1 archaeon SCGC-AAA833F18]|uniref:3-isopropylmalate dehydratase small subunit n=2 Tax=candidate division MSBL1 TaxID=215777 RepID=A0A133VT88_9EURY|nr:3-isopropylmalate dehydratase [candidate division MSBL1 archaeon SCGC-AAA261F17]KXB09664.1 3-isopropylmalate dehydratase [candidate division MSBL1 archaeon SCGC-AAA833F18]